MLLVSVVYSLQRTEVDMPIPEHLNVMDQRVYKADQWGSVSQDGPDKLQPDQCFWYHGVLHCRPISSNVSNKI